MKLTKAGSTTRKEEAFTLVLALILASLILKLVFGGAF